MKVTTLKGIFPDPKPLRKKNFIHENVKSLRRMEKCFQASKEVELQKLQLCKYQKAVDKYQNVSARVITNFQEKKKHQDVDTILKDNINSTLVDKIENKKQQPQDEIDVLQSDAKHVSASKKIFKTKMDNNLSNKQKKQERTNKCNEKYNQRKVQSKVLSEPSITHKFGNTVNNTNIQNTVKYKNQGIQTLDMDQIESIYSEGIIRYPSEQITKHDDAVSDTNLNKQEEKALKLQSDSLADRGDMHTREDLQKLDIRNTVSPTHKEQVDFIKLNKEYTSVANKLAMQLNSGTLPSYYRKGVVPKYLHERKEARQKELKAKTEASHPDCPEDHVLLPDHERKETLQLPLCTFI